jgi:hypothetical protein
MSHETTELTFDKHDANNLYVAIPGPYFEGDDFAGRLQDLQDWLTANGHEEDSDELETAFEAFQEASGEFHCAVSDVLERHKLM